MVSNSMNSWYTQERQLLTLSTHGGSDIFRQPFFIKAMTLDKLTGDCVYEAIHRQYPFNCLDPAAVHSITNQCDEFYMMFDMDRSSANISCLAHIFHDVEKDAFTNDYSCRAMTLPWCLPC